MFVRLVLGPVLLLAPLLVSQAGCAAYQERRALMQTLEEDQIVLRGGPAEFPVGSRVAFVRDHCPPSRVEGVAPACESIRVGEGTVERIVDGQHVLVRVDPGVKLGGVSRVEPAGRAPATR